MAIYGIDEAGRGPWAGPVVAAAVVILPSKGRPKGLADTKLLTPEAREKLALAIRACAIIGIGLASPSEIDVINILQATFLAMRRAVAAPGRATGRSADRRQFRTGAALPGRDRHRGRRSCRVHLRRLDHRQGRTRSQDGVNLRALSWLRVRQAQGLRHARTPSSPGSTRTSRSPARASRAQCA